MRRSPNTPAFHDVVTIRRPPNDAPMRVIVTGDGLFQPLIDYFSTGRARVNSFAWQRKVAHSIGLLYDFTCAYPPPTDDDALRRYLQLFVQTLERGTLVDGCEDPRGLFWRPAPRDKLRETAAHIIDFTDWLAERHSRAPLIGNTPATLGERLAAIRRYDMQANNAMLGHLKDRRAARHRAATTRALHTRAPLRPSETPPPAFPDQHFRRLIEEGFEVNLLRPDTAEPSRLRDAMIAIAQRAGGLRAHEVLHAFFHDVALDPQTGASRFAIAHPEEAADTLEEKVGDGTRTVSRTEYLKIVYDRVPRTNVSGSEHLGWKGCVLDSALGHRAYLFWVPSWWGVAFARLHASYRRLRPKGLRHPYLFVSHHADSLGNPYLLGQWHKNLAAAVRRIGLPVAKEAGTTSHGFRHAYLQTLVTLGLTQEDIKTMVRHSSLQSQSVYTRSTAARINEKLVALEPNLRALDAGLSLPPTAALLSTSL